MPPRSRKAFHTRSNKNRLAKEPHLAGRFLAFESLQDDSVKGLPTDRIWVLADKYNILARDRSLAYDLLTGTIKHRSSIDHLIELFSGRMTRRIGSDVLTLLRLGVDQLIYEDKIPEFAAVDTTCELARGYVGKPQIGFINAILRNIQRDIESRGVAINEENRRFVLPVGFKTGVKFQREILPDSSTPDYLALAYSYPKWLVIRWLVKWDFDTLREILSAGNARPGLVARPNRLKLESPVSEKLAKILTEQSCRVKVLAEADMVQLIEHLPITELAAFREGLFQIQDPTAGDVVKNLSLMAGMKILDLCAGLGTKTTQLAEATEDRAEIYACDRQEAKLLKLRENADRLGIKSIQTLAINDLAQDRFSHFFDVVLLDVPCSNTGVLDRRCEARWRLKKSDFQAYARQSSALLDQADRLTKPNGQIVFSTCSIDDEENSGVLESFCRRTKWTILKEHAHFPRVDPETGKTVRAGGYWAILNLVG